MSVKRYKPNTAGRRNASVDKGEDITKYEPEKALITIKKQHGGRSRGKISVRHQGGGEKRYLRAVDFRRQKYDIPANVAAIEYDPNRGARLALLHYVDGAKAYMLAPADVHIGDQVVSTQTKGEPTVGNRLRLEFIPVGMNIHDIEMEAGKGGQLVHGAGAAAQIMAVEGTFATVKLPSGEIRRIPRAAMATIGQVSNPDHRLIRWGKAGRMRHRGIRPSVRGKVMNPVDHPHGGGEAKNSIGLKHPKTPTGKPALGVKTRRKKSSDQLILQRRRLGRFVGGQSDS